MNKYKKLKKKSRLDVYMEVVDYLCLELVELPLRALGKPL